MFWYVKLNSGLILTVMAVSVGLAAWETLKEKTHDIDLILAELDLCWG